MRDNRSETTNLGGMVQIRTLLEHPEALSRVRDDRSLIPNAVNEIMRFAFGGPAGMQRFAVRDFELRGKKIRKGQMIMLAPDSRTSACASRWAPTWGAG